MIIANHLPGHPYLERCVCGERLVRIFTEATGKTVVICDACGQKVR